MGLLERARKHWFVGIISIAIICISITWVVAIELLVKPRDFKIEQQKEEITQLKEIIKQYRSDWENDDPGGIFHLLLIEVDEKEHREIRKWLIGNRSLGIPIDGTVIHWIKLKLK